MAKPKAILLTEGKHGMISQVEGMAQALQAEYSHKIVRLRFPWNFLPAKITPASQIILKDKIYLSNDDSSDIIISPSVASTNLSFFFCFFAMLMQMMQQHWQQ